MPSGLDVTVVLTIDLEAELKPKSVYFGFESGNYVHVVPASGGNIGKILSEGAEIDKPRTVYFAVTVEKDGVESAPSEEVAKSIVLKREPELASTPKKPNPPKLNSVWLDITVADNDSDNRYWFEVTDPAP